MRTIPRWVLVSLIALVSAFDFALPVGAAVYGSATGDVTATSIANSGSYTQSGTATNTFTGPVTIPNAATATQAVALGQSDGRYPPISYSQKIVIGGNYTLTAADSGKYLDVWSAPAGTVITLPDPIPPNFSVTLSPNNFALTISNPGNTAAYAQEGNLIPSAGTYAKPTGLGQTLYLHEFAGSLSAWVFGPTSAAKAGVAITVGASPFAYTAGAGGDVAISGGSVTAITKTRAGVVVWSSALASADVPVRAGDIVTITYTTAPTVYFLGN